MAGKTKHIQPQLLHIDGPGTRRLGRVHDHQKSMGFGKGAHPHKVRHTARDVGGMSHHNGLGVGAEPLRKLLAAQISLRVHAHKIHLHPLPTEAVEGPQNGVVLADRRQDMVARGQQAAECRIERLGRVGCKSDAGRAFGMKKLCQSFPGPIHQPGRMEGGFMGPTAGVARRLKGRQHRLPHFRRFLQGGGGVIQVDHGLTTFPACSSFSAMAYIFVTPPTANFSVRP